MSGDEDDLYSADEQDFRHLLNGYRSVGLLAIRAEKAYRAAYATAFSNAPEVSGKPPTEELRKQYAISQTADLWQEFRLKQFKTDCLKLRLDFFMQTEPEVEK